MDRKYFIVSFTLIVFFILVHVEKAHGCHPAGDYCTNYKNSCGAQILNATWTGGWNAANWLVYLDITVSSPTSYPQAVGHFTFSDEAGHHHRWLQNPSFTNCQCGESCQYQQNPYSSSWWLYDPYLAPPMGGWFDVWISVYWDCVDNGSESIQCLSEDIHYRGQNNNNVYPHGSSSQ
ncbi:hypothetical protein C2G38_2032586 [Gigaspora rosea]|uniref:Uncharacterized protein n=1 Tax=Gigaspora rosea TaxID=44941 RepID=A0A397VP07_9GLOM|nr:hypothetical protein C2G38_2032586 [Gigaspora rosea]CAG8505693.1 344_t:CDS:1 [Gigaspora rosea]